MKTPTASCPLCIQNVFFLLQAHGSGYGTVRNVVCDVCDKRFTHQRFLKAHVMSTHKEKNHHCQHCGKAFSELVFLKRHEKIHVNGKWVPFWFLIFTVQLHVSLSSLLKIRFTLSTGNSSAGFARRDSIWKIIGKTTKWLTLVSWSPCQGCQLLLDPLALLVRIWFTYTSNASILSGEKPLKCRYCRKGFIQKTALKKHEDTHENQMAESMPKLLPLRPKDFLRETSSETSSDSMRKEEPTGWGLNSRVLNPFWNMLVWNNVQ